MNVHELSFGGRPEFEAIQLIFALVLGFIHMNIQSKYLQCWRAMHPDCLSLDTRNLKHQIWYFKNRTWNFKIRLWILRWETCNIAACYAVRYMATLQCLHVLGILIFVFCIWALNVMSLWKFWSSPGLCVLSVGQSFSSLDKLPTSHNSTSVLRRSRVRGLRLDACGPCHNTARAQQSNALFWLFSFFCRLRWWESWNVRWIQRDYVAFSLSLSCKLFFQIGRSV